VGLNITVLSYRDHVDFGIVGDREQVDDAWSLVEGAQRALHELDELICSGGASPEEAQSLSSN
jgi:diacylglycerol O-acyltransferase